MIKIIKTITMISLFTSVLFIESTSNSYATAISDQSDKASVEIENLFKTKIAVAPDWAQKFPRVKAAISNELTNFLRENYAQGNNKAAEVQALEVRANKIYMRAQLRHYQRTRLLFGKWATAYDVTNTVETNFEPLNPSASLDGSRLCFDKGRIIGGGRVCVSAGDVIKIITKFL